MLLFHRVFLEMALVDNFLANQTPRTPPNREIKEVNNNDDEKVDTNREIHQQICRDIWIVWGFVNCY